MTESLLGPGGRLGVEVALSEKTEEGPERRCFAVFDGAEGMVPLSDLAAALLARQKENWPGLSDGYAALKAVRIREIRGDGWGVQVQFNSRRIVSSAAKLDPESIRRRPCFLCLENLPPEQQAILYRDDYFVLCNPMPIFPGQLTIAHRRHLPQSLPEKMITFLRLAADFGPRTTVFYNGPRAGASAPDHLHFQAAPAGLLPVEKEIPDSRKRTGARRRDGVEICRTAGLARGILVIEGKEEENVAAAAGEVIGMLGRSTTSDGEPPLNMLCTRTGEGWRLILFPRRKHRPDAYFREGKEGLLISPGALDMGGIIITPREEDFLALTPDLVSGIFREVAFDDAAIEALLALLSGKRLPV
ncbi:MAG: DUF4922 domain-containing protein [Deltaproteobacteria bacterium]|nr:DUF4922 domain-containing protein [Deltaproteobacteria bacterium]